MSTTLVISITRISLRLLLGLILLSTGGSKLIHPRRFQRAVQDYQLLPTLLEKKVSLSLILAWSIPLAELTAGLGLIGGLWLYPTLGLSLGLILLFSGAITINLLRGRTELSCGCAGALGSHRISWWLIGRNSLFIAGLLALLLTPADPFSVDMFVRSASVPSPVAWFTIALPATLLVGAILVGFLLLNTARNVLGTK